MSHKTQNMTKMSIRDSDIERVVCELLRADTHEARVESAKIAEYIGTMYGVMFGTDYCQGESYRASDHWIAWAENRLCVVRLPGAELSLFGDIIGFVAVSEGKVDKAWIGVGKQTADKLYAHVVSIVV